MRFCWELGWCAFWMVAGGIASIVLGLQSSSGLTTAVMVPLGTVPLVCGIGLFRRRNWARVACGLGYIGLFSFGLAYILTVQGISETPLQKWAFLFNHAWCTYELFYGDWIAPAPEDWTIDEGDGHKSKGG